MSRGTSAPLSPRKNPGPGGIRNVRHTERRNSIALRQGTSERVLEHWSQLIRLTVSHIVSQSGGQAGRQSVRQAARPAETPSFFFFGTCDIWNGEVWCVENLASFLKCHGKIRDELPDSVARHEAKPVNGGWYSLWALGRWRSFLTTSEWSLGWFALTSGRLHGTRGTCMPRALNMTPRKVAWDLQIPRHHWAHFCCAE